MRKIDIVACIMALLLTIALIGVFVAVPVFSSDTKRIHLITFAQDEDTQIEVKVGDRHYSEVLDKGINFLPYQTEQKPKIRILAYGDRLFPRVKKVSGEYYTYIEVKPPKDGDTE